MPILKAQPTLFDFQKYVLEMQSERGFINNTVLQNSLMLGEEVGELFKSIRKAEKIKIDNNSEVGEIGEEITDVFIYLCSLANHYKIDLEESFREKEEVNKKRVWTI